MLEIKLKKKNKLLLFILLVMVSSFPSCRQDGEEHMEIPNVVFILADDLGWPQTGAYGSTWYKTPNIEKLAGQGIRFTQAYSAAAICSPTRASVMTGKYPARIGLTDFIPGNRRDEHLLSQPEWQKFLPLQEHTLGELFKENGYVTAIFGKWHLSKDKRPPESLSHNPDKQGFDEYFVTYKPGKTTDPEIDPHNSDTITELSLDFLERMQDSSFFLFVSYNAIHDPLMESRTRISKFESDPGNREPENHPVIAAMLERMDWNIGRIIQKIDDLNLEEETLIVFYSDNGGKESYADQSPFRRGKGWLYEGGIRVPLIIRWKGKIDENIVSDDIVISNDFYPTFAELLDNDSIASDDGVSILPNLLYGEDIPERNIFWHYPHYHHGSGMVPASAMRSGDYKIIEWMEKSLTGEDDFLELYNLKADPGENINLADSLPLVRDSLYAILLEWRKDMNAGMPVINRAE